MVYLYSQVQRIIYWHNEINKSREHHVACRSYTGMVDRYNTKQGFESQIQESQRESIRVEPCFFPPILTGEVSRLSLGSALDSEAPVPEQLLWLRVAEDRLQPK